MSEPMRQTVKMCLAAILSAGFTFLLDAACLLRLAQSKITEQNLHEPFQTAPYLIQAHGPSAKTSVATCNMPRESLRT
jgi:hypothetical protein